MGYFLNNDFVYINYKETTTNTYFVDKSDIISELIPSLPNIVGRRQKYLALLRPHRFGKTVMGNMISSYFSKGVDSHQTFDNLNVSKYPRYKDHLNKHNVIHINFSDVYDDSEAESYDEFISYIKSLLIKDLMESYPKAGLDRKTPLVEAFNRVYLTYDGESFIFIFDEWDYIYHDSSMTNRDKEAYTKFLSRLLKDKAYVEMAYMTGILPIAKYSKGSDLNMFAEYTMAKKERYNEYFGFLDSEVDALYDRYKENFKGNIQVSREGLRLWYDGYHTKSGERVYNPRFVVLALENNSLGSFWTESG